MSSPKACEMLQADRLAGYEDAKVPFWKPSRLSLPFGQCLLAGIHKCSGVGPHWSHCPGCTGKLLMDFTLAWSQVVPLLPGPQSPLSSFDSLAPNTHIGGSGMRAESLSAMPLSRLFCSCCIGTYSAHSWLWSACPAWPAFFLGSLSSPFRSKESFHEPSLSLAPFCLAPDFLSQEGLGFPVLGVVPSLAPKMHIGGSGMHAEKTAPPALLQGASALARSSGFAEWTFSFALAAAQSFARLFVTLWGICGVALFLLLSGHLRLQRRCSSATNDAALSAAGRGLVLCLACTRPSCSVLNWAPWTDRKGRIARIRSCRNETPPRSAWIPKTLWFLGAAARLVFGWDCIIIHAAAMMPTIPAPVEPVAPNALLSGLSTEETASHAPSSPGLPRGSRLGVSNIGFPPPGGPYVSVCDPGLWPVPCALPRRPS